MPINNSKRVITLEFLPASTHSILFGKEPPLRALVQEAVQKLLTEAFEGDFVCSKIEFESRKEPA